jgi:hypothetical protein
VTATNECGTVTETILITYNNCIPPAITGLGPVANNANVSSPSLTLSMQVANMPGSQGIVLTQNGSPISNFNFAGGTVQALVTLIKGPNLFTITLTNACGTITESLTINYNPEEQAEQKITICHYPPGNNGNPQTLEIPLSAWPAHQAHGDILGPCPPTSPGNNGNQGGGNQGGNGNSGNNGNQGGGNNDQGVGQAEQKITICHYPPGNRDNPQTIEIPLSAWPAHQGHGDVLGPCPPTNPGNNGNPGGGNGGKPNTGGGNKSIKPSGSEGKPEAKPLNPAKPDQTKPKPTPEKGEGEEKPGEGDKSVRPSVNAKPIGGRGGQ